MTEQAFIELNARIKLRKRHLHEWDTLAVTQQKVLSAIEVDNAQKLSMVDGPAYTAMIREQTARLFTLMARQRQDRVRMKTQQQEEKAALKQLFSSAEENEIEKRA